LKHNKNLLNLCISLSDIDVFLTKNLFSVAPSSKLDSLFDFSLPKMYQTLIVREYDSEKIEQVYQDIN
jgi:hypothetical protein